MGVAGGFDRAKVIDEICERISHGEALRAICREDHMPSFAAIYDWLAEMPDFATRFARAREVGEDVIGQECLSIADEPPAINRSGGVDGAHVQHQKLRIETRLKLLAKWNPKKWGERIQQDVQHTGLTEILAAVDGSALAVKRDVEEE